MRAVLYLLFLLVAALQDLRKKRVSLWVYVAAAIAASLTIMMDLIFLRQEAQIRNHMASMGVGVVLLVAGSISRGGIGAGDGLFFAIAGLFIGFWENVMILCYSTFLSGLYGLGYYVWNVTHGRNGVGKEKIPFLPFVVVPGVWIVMEGVMRSG